MFTNNPPWGYTPVYPFGTPYPNTIGQFPVQRVITGDVDFGLSATQTYVGLTAGLTVQRNWNLPLANTYPTGVPLTLVDEVGGINGTSNIKINAGGGDLIEGVTSVILTSAFAGTTLYSDGTSRWTSGPPLLYQPVMGRVDNVSLKIIAATNILKVPPGLKFILQDAWIIPTSITTLTIAGNMNIIESGGSNPMANGWTTATATLLTSHAVPAIRGVVANDFNYCAAGNFVQFSVTSGVTATLCLATIEIIGFFTP